MADEADRIERFRWEPDDIVIIKDPEEDADGSDNRK